MAKKDEKIVDSEKENVVDVAEASAAKKSPDITGLAELIIEACKAFGVALEYLFASSISDGVATIITNGGKRVKYKAGDKVEKLDDIAITGINPKLAKRKVIAGKAKG